MTFLPVTKAELNGTTPDFIVVSVDAYVDHPSFGHAVIARYLQKLGYNVAIIPQPKTEKEYTALGAPKYAFLISGGVVDSMVNNYTVAKKKRTSDLYSEGGKVGRIPDRAVTVHTKNIKKYFPDSFVIIGGVEATLRKFSHYDYWSDSVMPSVLVSSGADMISWGPGEKTYANLKKLLDRNIPICNVKDLKGTAYYCGWEEIPQKIKDGVLNGTTLFLPSYEEVKSDKLAYVKAFNLEYKNSSFTSPVLIQKHGLKYLVVMPPQPPMTTKELDEVYDIPYERNYHPMYKEGVPALSEVKFSITAHRGCFGNCNYCAITLNFGRTIIPRSKESIIKEAERLTGMPDFKGYINDLGGPTANFHAPSCKKQLTLGTCSDKSCIGYENCPALTVEHKEYFDILDKVASIPGVKKVFIRSGIRYDYLMMDPEYKTYLKKLCQNNISGQLKVAPEHCSDKVLKAMNKPPFSVYVKFAQDYKTVNKELGKEQYVVPYLISSHPGCTIDDALKLSVYIKSTGHTPLQVQDFYPTPSTKSTTMYYTGLDPDTLKPVYVAKTATEKQLQRALLQPSLPQNKALIEKYLPLYKKDLKENKQLKTDNKPNLRSDKKQSYDKSKAKYYFKNRKK